MIRRARITCLAAVALASAASIAAADVTLGSLFNDHMVLQRDHANPLWGKATPNARVEVTIDGKSVSRTEADTDGSFRFTLPKLAAGGPHVIAVTDDGKPATINDVLIGDVWVCSGQSNMQWSLESTRDAATEIAAATLPNVRLYHVPRVGAAEPVKTVEAQWTPCEPETAKNFSAVAYFFARHLNNELNVPIGLIHTSWGGTPAEAWTPLPKLETLTHLPVLQTQLARRAAGIKGEALAPSTQPMKVDNQNTPASLYNGMIAPLQDFGIKGAIWYQGESNASRFQEYETLLSTMIESWRDQFGQGDFPFYIVGLANFHPPIQDPNIPSEWAGLREAQRQVGRGVKNAAMTVTIDIGEEKDIHPRNKQDVGKRLALVALADTYDKKLVSRGPTVDDVEWKDGQVIITFNHIGGGLKSIHEPLESFAVAGEDGKWFWADAKIDDDGGEVILSSPNVKSPTKVRYAWADNPKATLFNAEGLPAEPFEAAK